MTHAPADFDQFMKTRAEIARAYVNGDTAPLGEIVARQGPATFFPPRGGHVRGAEEVWKADREAATHFEPGSDSRLEILDSGESGDLAYWVGIQHAQVKMKDRPEPVSMEARVTEVFRRQDGQWKLVHRHADMLDKPPAPPGR